MARALDEAAREDGWWLDSLDDSVMKAGDEVLKEIIIRGIRSLEMNRRLGLEKEKLELIIKLHFPKEVEDQQCVPGENGRDGYGNAHYAGDQQNRKRRLSSQSI